MLTVKDLKDLATIYKDCDDYKITVWDANQQKRYKLVFTGSSKTDKTMSFNLVEDALSDKEQYQIDLLNKLITLNRQIHILKEEYNKTNAEYESQKIPDKQFIFDVIKKGFEIAGAPINWSSWDELVEYSKEHKQWYTEAVFTTVEQYNQWKSYFYEHFYDWKPKRYSKKVIQREFSWLSLMYGPKFEFDISEIKYD